MTVALKKKADALASKLTLKQRIEFADRLIAGVEDFADPELGRAWDREIKRRLDEYRAGKVKTVPAKQVHREMKRILHEIKARRISSRRAA